MAGRGNDGSSRIASRRAFLGTAAMSALTIVSEPPRLVAFEAQAERVDAVHTDALTRLSENLFVFHGAINVGIVRDGNRALLIDCDDGAITESLAAIGVDRVEQIALTHYHRDQFCGIDRFSSVATVDVPAREQKYLAQPSEYWNDDRQLYRVYRSFRPDHLMPVQPIRTDRRLENGDQIMFGPATLRVVNTPGHTEGSISYLVEVDGKRVVFSGDCIYGHGKIWDVFSLQKGFERHEQQIGGYHGFMGDQWQLLDSLRALKELKPDLVVPSHGVPINKPIEAIDALKHDLAVCYENYVSISALRHYFPRLFTEFSGRPSQMPIRPGIEPPKCLRHFGTTWMIVSNTGGAFVMDVGGSGVVDRLKKLLADGEISRVEALWVTHYHYDHTDGIAEFQRQFDCPCLCDRRLADVLVKPASWRLPCLGPEPIQIHKPLDDGQSWMWNEFKMTSYHYPGQTLYHGGLLVEAGELRMFFVGDSHTMAGLDDYCAHNRNFLGRNVGFQYCLSLIERLKPTHIFNCHVDDAFTFTPDEIQFMRRQLDERERLFGKLVGWEHANFGLDPSWVRADPYRQEKRAGQTATIEVVVTNHANSPRQVACRANGQALPGNAHTEWSTATVAPRAEQRLPLSIDLPPDARKGRHVVPIDIRLAKRRLPSFSECIIDVV